MSPLSWQVVIIASHGGLRNADAYFCAVAAMEKLAGRPQGSVAVFAPRFLYLNDGPMDAPRWEGSAELYWNGSKVSQPAASLPASGAWLCVYCLR